MRRARPSSVLVLAILHLVGGGLGLIGSVCGLAGQAMSGAMMSGSFGPGGGQQAKAQADMMRNMEEKIPAYQAVQYTQLAVGFLLSSLMIISGIGLLQMRPWGRSLSIVYAILSILNHIFMDIYNFGFMLPGMKAVMRDFANQDPNLAKSGFGPMMENFAVIGPVLSALLIAYPIFTLIMVMLPNVRAAFLGNASTFRRDDDFERDEADDEPWGRRQQRDSDDRIQPDER